MKEDSETLDVPTLLWVDLRREKLDFAFHTALSGVCEVRPAHNHSELIKNIETVYPDIICFEYDFPNTRRLQALQQTKNAFPSIPILMITEHHSEALAIWALRARVWDYLVKPVGCDDLRRRISALSSIRAHTNGRRSRNMILPSQADPATVEVPCAGPRTRSVHRAIDYIGNHFQEKVSISVLALLCNMSPSQFTRTFKREVGLTVREYLVSYRIDKACEHLKTATLSVGDVAFASGFPDHSYFSRMFRRYTGLSPSDYRLHNVDTDSRHPSSR